MKPQQRKLPQQKNSEGLDRLRNDAKIDGAVAGRTHRDIEKQTGKKVISQENFIPQNAKSLTDFLE